MSTIFFSGSISIKSLNAVMLQKLDAAMQDEHYIILGDANGVDSCIQEYLVTKGYTNVMIYVSGANTRNNKGNWVEKHIEVPMNYRGSVFYAEKDKAMAREADIGVMFWDGNSIGTWNNVINMIRGDKLAVVCMPSGRVEEIRTIEEAERLYKSVKFYKLA